MQVGDGDGAGAVVLDVLPEGFGAAGVLSDGTGAGAVERPPGDVVVPPPGAGEPAERVCPVE